MLISLSLSSIYILILIWLDLCLSQLAPSSYKSNPREWGFHCNNDCNKRGICAKGNTNANTISNTNSNTVYVNVLKVVYVYVKMPGMVLIVL